MWLQFYFTKRVRSIWFFFQSNISTSCLKNVQDCNDNSKCTTDYCIGGQCHNDPIICSHPDRCVIPKCDPIKGCDYTTKKNCSAIKGVPDVCADWYCDPSDGECYITPKNCYLNSNLADDLKDCETLVCEISAGGCYKTILTGNFKYLKYQRKLRIKLFLWLEASLNSELISSLGQTINKCGQCNKDDNACAFIISAKDASIAGGVLAAIIIGIFAGVAIIGYSSKKGLQYILSKQVIILLKSLVLF